MKFGKMTGIGVFLIVISFISVGCNNSDKSIVMNKDKIELGKNSDEIVNNLLGNDSKQDKTEYSKIIDHRKNIIKKNNYYNIIKCSNNNNNNENNNNNNNNENKEVINFTQNEAILKLQNSLKDLINPRDIIVHGKEEAIIKINDDKFYAFYHASRADNGDIMAIGDLRYLVNMVTGDMFVEESGYLETLIPLGEYYNDLKNNINEIALFNVQEAVKNVIDPNDIVFYKDKSGEIQIIKIKNKNYLAFYIAYRDNYGTIMATSEERILYDVYTGELHAERNFDLGNLIPLSDYLDSLENNTELEVLEDNSNTEVLEDTPL